VNDREHQNFRRAMRRGLHEEPDTSKLAEAVAIAALITWAGACLYLLGVIR